MNLFQITVLSQYFISHFLSHSIMETCTLFVDCTSFIPLLFFLFQSLLSLWSNCVYTSTWCFRNITLFIFLSKILLYFLFLLFQLFLQLLLLLHITLYVLNSLFQTIQHILYFQIVNILVIIQIINEIQ